LGILLTTERSTCRWCKRWKKLRRH